MQLRLKLLLSGLAVVLVATGIGGWFAYRAWAERGLQAALEEARRNRSAGRFVLAAAELRELAEAWPKRADVAYELALAEQARGRPAAARAALAKIDSDSPMAGEALVLRAQLEIRLGRLSAAETVLNEALEARPRSERPEIRDALVRLLRSEGRFAEARRLFIAGFDEWPDPIGALRALYRLDVDPYPLEGVRRYLDNAARQEPEDDRVWLGRAHFATQLGEFDEAERLLDACRERRPNDAAVWRARLEWGLAAGLPETVRDALPHLPADPAEAERLRAWFAARLGKNGEVSAALEKLLEHSPGDVPALNRLSELSLAAGRADAAERYRRLQTEVNRAREAYRKRLAAAGARDHAAELADLAATLGLGFEAGRWSILANAPPPAPSQSGPEPFASTTRRSLADLLPDILALDKRALATERPASLDELHFADDAARAGLSFAHDNGSSADATRLIPPLSASGGVGLLDYDGDGWLDVYCVQGGPFPPDPSRTPGGDRLFHNRGDGTFEDVSERSGLASQARGYGHGVAVGDYDGDGRPDLFVTRWRAYALYRNKGNGTFEDVTRAVGLDGDRDWPTSAAFADLDGDGDLDLYVCHYLRWDENDTRTCVDPKNPGKYNCNPLAFEALPDHLFRNDRGRFVDVSAEAGIVDRDGRGLGVVAADLDQDGRVDLFVANDMSANYLFHNRGGFRFEESAVASGVAANGEGGYQAGMGVACGDLNGDGHPDLVVTNYYGESTTFFQNLGGGAFADHSAAVGLALPSRYRLGFGVALPDVNNDGRLDLLTANGHIHDGRPQFPFAMPLQLFLGTEGGRLVDVTGRAGPPFGLELLARGLAAGDLDNDGRLDALVVAQNAPLVYLHNQANPPGHFLTLELEGRTSNRDAVGAEVTVSAGGKTLRAWRLGGGSYQSADDPRLHFGLNQARTVEQIEVRWPSGTVEKLGPLDADTGYRIREGERHATPLAGFATKHPGVRNEPKAPR